MSFKRVYIVLVLSIVLQSGRAAQNADLRTEMEKKNYKEAMEDADKRIFAEVKAHSELIRNLEYLTTNIGARLTGSKEMQQASDWALKRFQDYGIDAHLETIQIPHGWTRGMDTAEVLAPKSELITIHALGWSKPTPGPVIGRVVAIQLESASDFEKLRGKLKGAVVLVGKPATVHMEYAENAYDAVIPTPHALFTTQEVSFPDRRRMISMIASEEPAAVLADSGKTDNLYHMANCVESVQVPQAVMTHEDYSRLYRLAQDSPVTMKLNITGTFSDGPVTASTTVAKIRGSEHPEEAVIIGGHLDSWDLGQGALDNGTGSMAVLEAARALKALGWKPKRTIIFILFTGEEQGNLGSEKYVKDHAAEMPKVDAVLIHDTGTGKVFSIALENLYETGPLMAEIYEPLQDIFDLQPISARFFRSSDHMPFLHAGVPSYFCIQNPAHYREAHHSQTDTFDKVIPDEVNEGAAFLAAWAWNVSEMPLLLPHHPRKV